MSRTVRRKNVSLDTCVTHNYERIDGWWVWVDIPKEGKELAKSIAMQRSDNGYYTNSGCGSGPGKWFRQNEQQSYRARCNQEIHKFLRDESYEIQIQANPYLPYWD